MTESQSILFNFHSAASYRVLVDTLERLGANISESGTTEAAVNTCLITFPSKGRVNAKIYHEPYPQGTTIKEGDAEKIKNAVLNPEKSTPVQKEVSAEHDPRTIKEAIEGDPFEKLNLNFSSGLSNITRTFAREFSPDDRNRKAHFISMLKVQLEWAYECGKNSNNANS